MATFMSVTCLTIEYKCFDYILHVVNLLFMGVAQRKANKAWSIHCKLVLCMRRRDMPTNVEVKASVSDVAELLKKARECSGSQGKTNYHTQLLGIYHTKGLD